MLEQRARAATARLNLWNATSMFEVARLLGDALREVQRPRRPVPDAEQHRLQRQLPGRRPDPRRAAAPVQRLQRGQLHRGDAGDLYFQIGETKYGKPIIDRVVTRGTRRWSTRPSACWSRSTRRCARNISVGLPIDLLIYQTDACASACSGASRKTDPLLPDDRTREWGEGLRRVFARAARIPTGRDGAARLPDPSRTR